MTGYGRGESVSPTLRVTVELRSVNHRFLDVKMKLPRSWLGLEQQLTQRLRDRLGRGRVDVHVHREIQEEARRHEVRVNRPLAVAIRDEVAQLADELGLPQDLGPSDLLRIPGVLEVSEPEVDVTAEAAQVEEALDSALSGLEAMREAEGERLVRALRGYLSSISGLVDSVERIVREQPALLKARLEARVLELLGSADVDAGRVAQEAAILADKADVDEELCRLRSHVEQASELLGKSEPVGRRLEFLVQEFLREANTIASKSAATEVSALAVELKSEIEKVREQVANLE
ncbi:MAG: YicC family protein [Deltaproteobacteria bacterium]|nr:YicC family protein [Deltaproteobacteria bacterium]